MTDRRPRRPSPVWVFGAAFGAFALVLALLAVQVRTGRDSALGAGTPVAAAPAERPRRIVVRRIVRTTVITHVGAGDRAPSAPARPAPASPAPAAPAAPVAPAPPPAPVTTRAS